MLYLVPTPIGNLQDMTPRAIETLRSVDLILAEDSRNTGRLLKHFEIDTTMTAYHAHNEHRIVDHLIHDLISGRDMALVSDAGTPAISDPGFLLVRMCHEHQVPVTCLPGASALLPALAISGIPCDRFYFEGFLPHKKGRKTRIEYLGQLDCTVALYESPHRIIKTLSELLQYLKEEREVAVVREISKMYETIYRGSLTEVKNQIEALPSIKGEFVIVMSRSSTDKKNENIRSNDIRDKGHS
jgi:16S rRNA (cytidine1402-2'-O)-methyltransferase